MSTVNNIPTGLLVPAQVPLDAKLYIADEASLMNLGIASNLAYTYYEGMIVYCVAEKRRYEWREGSIGEVGLLPVGFTYPSSLVVNGLDYSNRTFNFFYVLQNMNMSNVGIGAPWYKGFDIPTNAHQFRTFLSVGLLITTSLNEIYIESRPGVNVGTGSQGYKGVNASTKLHEFRTFKSMNPAISINQVGDEIQFNATFYNTLIQAGNGISVSGDGTAGNPYIISLAATASPWLRGDIKEVFCTPTYMTTYFLQSGPNAGFGIGERAGWAICNGNNGTPPDDGRVVVAWGASYPVLNATAGATSHTLLESEMPIHNHDWLYGTEQDDDSSGGSNDEFTATAQGNWGPNNGVLTPPIANKGGGQPHNNMQPYVVRLKIMKL
jgi:hypothetical protein